MAKKVQSEDQEREFFPGEDNSIQMSRETQENTENDPPTPLPIRKVVSIALIILVIIIVLVLVFNLFGQTNNTLFGPDGKPLSSRITTSTNGEVIDSQTNSGNILSFKGNTRDRKYMVINGGLKINKDSNISLLIRRGGLLKIIHEGEDFFIDENGGIHISIDPEDDLNLDEYYDENTGTYIFPPDQNIDFTIEIVIEDPNGNTTIIDIDSTFIFQEYSGEGCIELSRSSIRETTHYGVLETPIKIKVGCEDALDLSSFITWKSARMGNVEVIIGNKFEHAVILSDKNSLLFPLPPQDEYEAKIIFTPFKEYAGKRSQYSVNFGMGEGKAKIDFDVALDNLEQCIKISPDKIIIPSDQDSSSFTIDVSSCSSQSITFSLCDNDEGCAGGVEGGISLSQNSFSLNPKGNSSEQIIVSRQEIPGAYGVSINARIPGTEKTFIDDKLVLVEPQSNANLVPDKFVVSLMGQGAMDSVIVHNKTLAEDVPIESSVCTMNKSSTGKTGESNNFGTGTLNYGNAGGVSWWKDLVVNPERYAGTGKYAAALLNILGPIDNVRTVAQLASTQQNWKIKNSYLTGPEVKKYTFTELDSVNICVEKAQILKDKMAAANEFAQGQMMSQMASMVTNIATLATDIATLSAQTESVSGQVSSITPCAGYSGSAASTISDAAATSNMMHQEIFQGVSMINQVYSLYQQMSTIGQEVEQIDAAGALQNSLAAQQKMTTVTEKAVSALSNLTNALGAAAIDSFSTASIDDERAKQYLESTKQDFETMTPLVDGAITDLLNAKDDITIAIQETQDQTLQMILQMGGMITQLSSQLLGVQSKSQAVQQAVQSTNTTLTAALPTVTAQCVASQAKPPAGDPVCCTTQGQITAALPQVAALQARTGATIAQVVQKISMVNSGYNMLNQLQMMTNDYTQAFGDFDSALGPTIKQAYDSKSVLAVASSDVDPAISAADWLMNQEKYSSEAAKYIESVVSLPGNFNKARLTGLVGSAISNGFVNGAFEADSVGGVYTTEAPPYWSINLSNINSGIVSQTNNSLHFAENSLLEGCNNIVLLTLPDYIINLSEEGKNVTVSNNDIFAQWMDTTAKVFDVWNEQEMSVSFANRGASKNGYGLVEFSAYQHVHDKPTKTSLGFGPFNITDAQKELVSYKYHFRFNVQPQKGNNFVPVNNDCTSGLVRGETGLDAAPKVLASWDWSSVNGLNSTDTNKPSVLYAKIGAGGSSEPFIDATQLSILLSKKIGALSDFMDSTQISCPVNPAQIIFDKVRPVLINPSTGQPYEGLSSEEILKQRCYLPLTTRNYDGLPALVYFLENSSIYSSNNGFKDVEKVNDVSELMNLIDFNANLMRDGYGWGFQNDFAYEYTRSMLKAGPSFTDNDRGAKKYFQDADYARFSSPALAGANKKVWALPDAGKYNIRIAVDFDDSARLFDGSRPAAKIIFNLYLLDPVNNNYSPLYYLPIDGSVAINANSDGYATGFSSAAEDFPVSKPQGAVLSASQKNSLVKSTYTKINDFSLLNSLASQRGKLIDISYAFDAKNFSDSNSKIIFSPTLSTPLLLELNGEEGTPTEFFYSVKRDNMDIRSKTNSLLLVSGVASCSNLAGKALSDYYYKSPDENYGQYGIVLPTANTTGKTYLKTITYAPMDFSFGIQQPKNGVIISANGVAGSNNLVALEGISGMPMNDRIQNSVPDSLANVLVGVEKKSICVSSMGSREIFYWPEDAIYSKKGTNGEAFTTKENLAKSSCVE